MIAADVFEPFTRKTGWVWPRSRTPDLRDHRL